MLALLGKHSYLNQTITDQTFRNTSLERITKDLLLLSFQATKQGEASSTKRN